ncbi:MAG: hypothetical protein JWQ50_4248, partial [Caballeronia mineralivorans]|nr:hypothetical protein [Caballeronia mineralivorans]
MENAAEVQIDLGGNVVLGQHPPHARLQSGAPQQAGRPGAGGLHESGMFPLRAHSPGEP